MPAPGSSLKPLLGTSGISSPSPPSRLARGGPKVTAVGPVQEELHPVQGAAPSPPSSEAGPAGLLYLPAVTPGTGQCPPFTQEVTQAGGQAGPAPPAGEAHEGAKISRGQAQDSSQKLRGSHLGVFPSLKLGAWPALPTCGFLPSAPGPRPGSSKKGLCPHGISTRQGDSVGDKAAPWIQGSESGKSPGELGFVLHPWQSITRAGPHPQSPLKWKCQYDKGHR